MHRFKITYFRFDAGTRSEIKGTSVIVGNNADHAKNRFLYEIAPFAGLTISRIAGVDPVNHLR